MSYNLFVYTQVLLLFLQLIDFNYCYLMQIILLNINQLFADCEWVTSIAINTNYSIQHNSFICTQSNGSRYCYVIPKIQLRHRVYEFQVLVHWWFGFYGIPTFVELFNAKSTFMKIVLFQTIQFSINTQFKCKNQFSSI